MDDQLLNKALVAIGGPVELDYHSLNNLWASGLAVVGLLDILACYVLPDLVEPPDDDGRDDAAPETTTAADDPPSRPPRFSRFVRWLHGRGDGVFLLFSALWFVDALFFVARDRRGRASAEEERRRLLAVAGVPGDAGKRRNAPPFSRCGSIALQFLLMPIGCYFVAFRVLGGLFGGGRIEGVVRVGRRLAAAAADGDDVAGREDFSSGGKLSLAFAILQAWSGSTMRAANAGVASVVGDAKRRATRMILGKAIRNPLRFRRELGELLTKVRWIKYLAPLVGSGNKLLGTALDVLRRRELRARAGRARRARRLLWGRGGGGPPGAEMTEGNAAIRIQTAFRAYRVRRRMRYLRALQRGREYLAALRVQRKLREKLKRARERLAARVRELKRLERMKKKNSATMSDDDKRFMYQLQDELGEEAREMLNRRLLLRPNTKFAVSWKIFFVITILCEMTQKAAEPRLRGDGKKGGDAPATMGEFVARTLVPARTSDLPTCRGTRRDDAPFRYISNRRGSEADGKNREDLPWYCHGPIAEWRGGFRDLVALALVPAPVSRWPECRAREGRRTIVDRALRRRREGAGPPLPWYCLGSRPARHALYRDVADAASEGCRRLLGAVTFLDVFVSFFTGAFHRTTGELVPTPWFPRWIAPGLGLQLVVNPSVADVYGAASRCARNVAEVGPVRTYRHVVAVVFPLAYGVVHAFVEYVWLPMVRRENTVGVVPSRF